ncbi:MAG: hypothetical protein WCK21_00180 [Actinomycetota bacterium]
MRAAGLALLALAAVWPRWRSARALLACGAAALLVAAVWPASFRGRDNNWAVGGVWAVAAAAMARTGGIATSLPPAVSAALLCAAVATAVSAALCFLSRR